MKLHKLPFFIFILPLTLFLDLILFAMTKNCPTCGGGFGQFVNTQGALSFPIVVGFAEWFSQFSQKKGHSRL